MQAQQTSFLNLLNGQVQYVVPRWQRRYRWGVTEIERLVEDLATVAVAGDNASHYGGTLLTFPEPGNAAGVVQGFRVVDGQQRLTTVSLLLLCIAEVLGPEDRCEGWSAEDIRKGRLLNPDALRGKELKLRLQDGDNEEYQGIMSSGSSGIGAVSQAWKTLRRLVARHELSHLMKGLTRLQVVSMGLHDNEDPQQIFESINATGRPLTESEKVKNWLLIGYSERVQDDLFRHWQEMERALGATHSSWPVDEYLRDLLRWQTGRLVGVSVVYEEFRRWAVRTRRAKDRAAICREIVRLAKLYGQISLTPSSHPDPRVRSQLSHLKHMGIHTHRPLTLRLLDDAATNSTTKLDSDALVKCLELISTWITRLWISGRTVSGMNRAITDLAHKPKPEGDYSTSFLASIAKMQSAHVGIPSDSEVAEGIKTRKAYGGSATATSFQLLYFLNQKQNPGGEIIERGRLTVEHIMPQKLSSQWADYLGIDAEVIHGRWRDSLANLTLCGDETNPALGTRLFEEKKETYQRSPISITRDLARYDSWNERTLERRATVLTSKVIEYWPWEQMRDEQEWHTNAELRWRINGTEWRQELAASDMIVNVADTLVALDNENVHSLMGDLLTQNILRTDDPRIRVSNLTFKELPSRTDLVIHPYSKDYPTSIKRVREMGQNCGVTIEAQHKTIGGSKRFWLYLKQMTGGLDGQKDSWSGSFQSTKPLESSTAQICVYVGNPDQIWLYVRSVQETDAATIEQNLQYSLLIQEEMGDQQLGTDLGKDIGQYAKSGTSVTVLRNWNRDDESQWKEAAEWIHDQHNRLTEIVRQRES